MEKLFAALSRFPRKRFHLRHSKICKKLKNALFKRMQSWYRASESFKTIF